MKCAVIGTSNSLMKQNYLQTLRKISHLDGFDNYSVGGSPNILLPYVLSQHDLSAYGVALLETSVNDVWLIRSGAISQDRVARHLIDAAAYLKERGIQPVILILPVNSEVPEIGLLRRMLRKIAADQKLPLLDGYSVLEALRPLTRCPPEALFSDASHIAADLAEIIACQLQSLLETLTPETRSPKRVRKYPYSFLAAEGGQPVARQNSLFSKRYVRLTADQAISFDFKTPQELIGFAVNVTACSALVEVTIDGGETRHFDFRFAGIPENQILSFFHSLAPNPQPFTARRITLRVCRKDEAPTAPILLAHAKNSTLNAAEIEIEGLILRDCLAVSAITIPPSLQPMPPVRLSSAEKLLAERLGKTQGAPPRAKPLVAQLFPPDRDYAADRRADLLRDIGQMLLVAGEPSAALRILTEAQTDRPSGEHIQRLLREAAALVEDGVKNP